MVLMMVNKEYWWPQLEPELRAGARAAYRRPPATLHLSVKPFFLCFEKNRNCCWQSVHSHMFRPHLTPFALLACSLELKHQDHQHTADCG